MGRPRRNPDLHLPLDGGGWEGVSEAPISGLNTPHP